MANETDHKDDLPLMANSEDILVRHYVLDWSFDLEREVVEGSVIFILDPVQKFVEKHEQDQVLPDSTGYHVGYSCGGSVGSHSESGSDTDRELKDNSKAVSVIEIKGEGAVTVGTDEENLDVVSDAGSSIRHVRPHDKLEQWDCPCLVAPVIDKQSQECGEDKSLTDKPSNKLEFIHHVHSTLKDGNNAADQLSSKVFIENDLSKQSNVLKNNKEIGEHHRDLVCAKLGTCSCGLNRHDGMKQSGTFKFILDCCDLVVNSVEEVIIPESSNAVIFSNLEQDSDMLYEEYLKCKDYQCTQLGFALEKWCLMIWKEGVHDVVNFPRVVKVMYTTSPSGASLRWIKDQDRSPCVFTAAAWINNRSLFPCQEPPLALASWQAHVTVQPNLVVLMSGDQEPFVTSNEKGQSTFYYHTKMPHPAAVLAIAVGDWKCKTLVEGKAFSGCSRSLQEICDHQPRCKISYTDDQTLPSKIYAPASLLDKAYAEFKDYFRESFQAAYDTLGPHPFPRLDVLIIPRSFASLGLANPNLMFLSQSLITGDGSSCIRISHELSHSWFGILIGSRDWTEEWLSEGFATYMEDIIHARAMKWNAVEARHHAELRAMIRYRVLCAELENTQEELQSLRPSQGKDTRDPNTSVLYVKNGMNPDKRFTQVHYLKGYFLLRYLACLVGESAMNQFIRRYATEFHGKSVLSQELFALMFEVFPELSDKGITISNIYSDWLDNPGMPMDLTNFQPSEDNHFFKQVLDMVNKWSNLNKSYMRHRKSPKKLKKIDISEVSNLKLSSEQVVLVFEYLLDETSLSKVTLQLLKQVYDVNRCNADIQHRWCELVVKHCYIPGYEDVKAFLHNHQAMGIYLYGELVLTGDKAQRRIAEETFRELGDEMEKDTYVSVREMVFGGDGKDCK